MQLNLEKLTVPAELPRISRTRLLEVLHESLVCCTASLISGRPGTGKTLLAADFAWGCGRRVAWYKIDAADADKMIFFEYLSASVRRQETRFSGENFASVLATASPQEILLLADAFVYELLEHIVEPLLIVIEDLDLIYHAEWVMPFFHRMLPLLPPEVHVLMTCRHLPPAPLWRMRSKQTLCVIEESMMAFTAEEARDLFGSYGLSDQQANETFAQSRGHALVLDKIAFQLNTAVKTFAASGAGINN